VNNKATEISDRNGEMISEPAEARKRWKEYIEQLYDEEHKPTEEEIKMEEEDQVQEDSKGPALLESEIREAIKEMKSKKAEGIDGIPAEILKTLGLEAMKEVIQLCKDMYDQGQWPKDFTRSIIIPIPKKPNAMKCEEYRTISLISHASKIMLKILAKRMEIKVQVYNII
jgi:antitoxin component of MazEF toxin-antitoxin module